MKFKSNSNLFKRSSFERFSKKMKFTRITSLLLIFTLLMTGVAKCDCPEGQIEQEGSCIDPPVEENANCVEDCLICSEGLCQACFPNFTLSKDDLGVQTCTAIAPEVCRADTFQNPSWTEGEDLSSRCLSCSENQINCQLCLDGNSCLKCETGFQLNQSGDGCVPVCPVSQYWCAEDQECQDCNDHCEFCWKSKTCLRCNDGYRLATDGDRQICLTCDTSNGKYMDESLASVFDNNCFDCSPNCKTCTNSGLCTTCDEGFELSVISANERAYCYKAKDICSSNEFNSHISKTVTVEIPAPVNEDPNAEPAAGYSSEYLSK